MFYANLVFTLLASIGGSVSQECGIAGKTRCCFSKYRTYDGSCNNLEHPAWGTPFTRYGRLLPAKYGDGRGSFPLAKSGKPLPNPRNISFVLYPDAPYTDNLFTLNAMQYGQIITHDISLTVLASGPFVCCSTANQLLPEKDTPPFCAAIPIPNNDPVYSRHNQTCMGFVKTTTDRDRNCSKINQPDEQLSQVTHYLDLSLVYGNSKKIVNEIRAFKGGRVRMETRKGQQWPRSSINRQFDCPPAEANETCYFGTDDRINQNTQLTLLQIVFLREHNRIAQELAKINPQWNDEIVFQESRKINIAQHQYISYYEWLPWLLGSEHLFSNRIIFKGKGFVKDYDKNVNPSASNEYAQAAFKHFHSTISGTLKLVEESRKVYKTMRISDCYFRPQVLEDEDNFDGLARGLHTQLQMASDRYHTVDVTNFMFRPGSSLGLDLKAIDIHRGRNHGLASYNDLRKFCGLPRAKSFINFLDHIPSHLVRILEDLYESPDDVDLVVGGSVENNLPGTLVGPTFHCILLEQFRRTRVADRHWFENTEFSIKQLNEIRKASMSRLICDNGKNIKRMQRNGFVRISADNPLILCDKIPRINLTMWKN